MLQVALLLVAILFFALGFSWLSDQSGSILVNFAGYEKQYTPVEFFLSLLVLMVIIGAVWILLQRLIGTPAFIFRFFKQRREKRGLEALSSGLIAVGVGDRSSAGKFALLARKSLPNEPLTALLRAQSAQLMGDRKTARRIYEAMLGAPDTEVLGLRGLFLEAQQEKEEEVAFQFAVQATKLDPSLSWAIQAVFQFQCKTGDWGGALETLELAKRYKHVERTVAMRRRAVLLTAQAIEAEDNDMDKALELALEAHKIAPSLVPAANIAGRIYASKGITSKAAKVVVKCWKLSPHPDLAITYGYSRTGDSPRDRFARIKSLAAMTPHSKEGKIAVSLAAIEAKDWDEARRALMSLLDHHPTARVCALMARIEAEEGDQGRMREWLARAVKAPRDPAWTADGYVSKSWLPVSPVNGEIDCFEWKVPLEPLGLDVGRDIEDVLPMEVVTRDMLDSKINRQDIVEPKGNLPVEHAPEDLTEKLPVENEVQYSSSAKSASLTTSSWTQGKLTEFEQSELKAVVPVSQVKNEEETEEIQGSHDDQAISLKQKSVDESQGSQEINSDKDQIAYQSKESLPPDYTKSVSNKEPKIYIPPRAPDDPGTGSFET